mmetsp:Transcript_63425/g.131957  ORF Transcript_63425/g.131957 Transcript_63425/m.131957 type:complete len:220 (-) Transcript_63425:6466-7125(-)
MTARAIAWCAAVLFASNWSQSHWKCACVSRTPGHHGHSPVGCFSILWRYPLSGSTCPTCCIHLLSSCVDHGVISLERERRCRPAESSHRNCPPHVAARRVASTRSRLAVMFHRVNTVLRSEVIVSSSSPSGRHWNWISVRGLMCPVYRVPTTSSGASRASSASASAISLRTTPLCDFTFTMVVVLSRRLMAVRMSFNMSALSCRRMSRANSFVLNAYNA